ncbi:Bifunctional cytokinin biosynthesis protein [Lachnellula hyalina]|uniref:Bifunctional cytokinin biosynthesis protein n=1 Tax=Lachnellula hyalina TaxID=1316788 RepID=A0A8H8TXK1_9HELO|nr:Bifunctional cytokinin biosynthesis protein [Lachnellula hyalina]TVY25602.1 Bifunctional cytokinin biosynthesis protein [Lachnellula hyalina]
MVLNGTSPVSPTMNAESSTPSLSNLPKDTLSPPAAAGAPVKICVFCGSSPGKSPAHMEAARALAQVMARNNIQLVYGGGTVGLMGEVARTLVSLSGPESVHGIIPTALVQYEAGPNSATESSDLPAYATYGKTTVVNSMHQRKEMMVKEIVDAGAGSGFVALSGGYGTLEELMEVVTWNQLGIHERGVCVLNIEGYWDGLLHWVEGSVDAGFVGLKNRNIIGEAKNGEEAVEVLKVYVPDEGRFKLKWGNE